MTIAPRLRRWLLGPGSDPSIRLRVLTELERRPAADPAVRRARADLGRTGWAAELLALQLGEGQWVTAGTSGRELYRPKYIATNWMAIVLAEMGLDRRDPRIRRTADLLLRRWFRPPPEGDDDGEEACVTGNAVRTLIRFGYGDDPDVLREIGWLVGHQKADGGWHCFRSRVGTLDAWEPLAALATIPADARSEPVQRAIARGAEFFLARRLLREGRPYAPWLRIHYPRHYYYDGLVGLGLLTSLGYGADRRLDRALGWLERRRRPDGTWAIDAAHPDLGPGTDYALRPGPRFPLIIEPPGAPSRWATAEALIVRDRAARARGRASPDR